MVAWALSDDSWARGPKGKSDQNESTEKIQTTQPLLIGPKMNADTQRCKIQNARLLTLLRRIMQLTNNCKIRTNGCAAGHACRAAYHNFPHFHIERRNLRVSLFVSGIIPLLGVAMVALIEVATLHAQSVPVLQPPVITSNITLTCSAEPGNWYQFQVATNLTAGSNTWSDMGSWVIPTNNAITIRDVIPPELWQSYFQVKMMPSNLVTISTIASVSYTGSPQVFINGNLKTLVFTANGTFTINAGSSGQVESLVIGGGGAGGYLFGGGGGAGGVIYTSPFISPTYSAGTYNVVVGAGGASHDSYGTGNNGGNSSFGNSTAGEIVAMGGGGGGGYNEYPGGDASSGGSGGGGGPPQLNGAMSLLYGAGSITGTDFGNSVAEGNSGGNAINAPNANSSFDYAGGGGGGAGGPGLDGSSVYEMTYNYVGTGGNGGNGKLFQMTGSAVYDTWYAGGGGGYGETTFPPAVSGSSGQGADNAGGGGEWGSNGRAGIVILRFKFQ